MTKKTEHHFLTVKTSGQCFFLTPLPGQTLKNEPIHHGISVKGCEKYRKSFPEGSIFGTTTLKKAHRRSAGFYQVEDLYYLGEVDPYTDLIAEATRQKLISEYKDKNIII